MDAQRSDFSGVDPPERFVRALPAGETPSPEDERVDVFEWLMEIDYPPVRLLPDVPTQRPRSHRVMRRSRRTRRHTRRARAPGRLADPDLAPPGGGR
jgi:hypothetical protein